MTDEELDRVIDHFLVREEDVDQTDGRTLDRLLLVCANDLGRIEIGRGASLACRHDLVRTLLRDLVKACLPPSPALGPDTADRKTVWQYRMAQNSDGAVT